jgi:streptogramin lyase
VDAKAKSIKSTVPVNVVSGLVTNEDSIWLLSDEKTTLTRIDPEANRIVAEVRLPAGCTSLASGEGALWATCPIDDKLLRIDSRTNLVKERIEIKGQPVAVASGEGSIWVLCKAEGKVARLDPKTNKVTATVEMNVPNASGAITVSDGSVWVSVAGFPIARIDPASDKVMQQFTGEGGGILYSAAASIWVGTPGQNTLQRFDPKRIRATLAE